MKIKDILEWALIFGSGIMILVVFLIIGIIITDKLGNRPTIIIESKDKQTLSSSDIKEDCQDNYKKDIYGYGDSIKGGD